MIGRLNDDLVRTDPVHAIEHTFGLAIHVAFNAQGRKLIGYNPDRPSGGVSLRLRPSIRVRTRRLNLRWRLALVSVAEGAEAALDLHIFANKIGWALRPVRRNNYPAADNRIFSEFRQYGILSRCRANFIFYADKEALRNTSICGRELEFA